mgnify:CR=1 FL=1
MTDRLFPALCGLLTGILSSWGVGGGTLLLLCMTLFFGVEQRTAQAINLLYFLPTAGISLFAHRKNGYLDKAVLRAAIRRVFDDNGRQQRLPQTVRAVPALRGAVDPL